MRMEYTYGAMLHNKFPCQVDNSSFKIQVIGVFIRRFYFLKHGFPFQWTFFCSFHSCDYLHKIHYKIMNLKGHVSVPTPIFGSSVLCPTFWVGLVNHGKISTQGLCFYIYRYRFYSIDIIIFYKSHIDGSNLF